MKSIRIGAIKNLVRYPVKSMAGIEMNQSMLGWHGLVGDRRYGVRKVNDRGDFPWLTASRLPILLLYRPTDVAVNSPELLPTRVVSPTHTSLEINGPDLRDEIGSMFGRDVELMALKHGIFDDAAISLIATSTAEHVCVESGVAPNSRRFRANIEMTCDDPTPFREDEWVGGVITFGESEDAPAIFVSKRDVRCKMIGLDPDTAEFNSSVPKKIVELNGNHAGVYGVVIRTGLLKVGDPISFSSK